MINELNSTVTTLRYDGERGSLREIQTISTLPKEFEGVSTCAELQLSPSGKYLYGSNRGHDSIVIYAIDPMSGMLSSIGHKSTQGKTPRHFMIDPEGAFLLAANQDSDNLVAFKIDSISGELSQVGSELYVPTPVCVRVL